MTAAHSPTDLARRIRINVLHMVHRANASHVGSCFSIAEILAVLYGQVMRVKPNEPTWKDRDLLVLSKGHAAAALYSVLAEVGYFPPEWLEHYCENDGVLAGHATHYHVPGVEVSSGALGHGLSLGCGMALAARADKSSRRAFVILSDGECDEGSIWEAALFAGHHGLDNLVVLLDFNRWQSFGSVQEVLRLEPLADKWRSFGWRALPIDGHDVTQIAAACAPATDGERQPTVIIANTVKGKGVSFMEDQLAWHYKSPNPEQLADALKELEAAW